MQAAYLLEKALLQQPFSTCQNNCHVEGEGGA
jgi:hypothetical protein